MASRAIIASVLLVGTLVPATFADEWRQGTSQPSAIVRFERPTWVATQILIGT